MMRILVRLAVLWSVAGILCYALPSLAVSREPMPIATSGSQAKPVEIPLVALRGRIVWLGEALRRKHGIVTDADALKSTIALETAQGELIPIVKDARGRGFHLDPRLHQFDYELLVRRFPGVEHVQIVNVYTFHEGKKYEFDYWCDICAIPMYELKDCECCQGPIRFRERLLGPNGPGKERNPGEAR